MGFANCLKLLHLIIARPVKQLREALFPGAADVISWLCQVPVALSHPPPSVNPPSSAAHQSEVLQDSRRVPEMAQP